jgi:hypothetical protein
LRISMTLNFYDYDYDFEFSEQRWELRDP